MARAPEKNTAGLFGDEKPEAELKSEWLDLPASPKIGEAVDFPYNGVAVTLLSPGRDKEVAGVAKLASCSSRLFDWGFRKSRLQHWTSRRQRTKHELRAYISLHKRSVAAQHNFLLFLLRQHDIRLGLC